MVPLADTLKPVGDLMKISPPINCWRRFICALMAGWVSSNSWAALVKLPRSAMATNVRNSSIGMCLLSYRRCIATRQSVNRSETLREASHEQQPRHHPRMHADQPHQHRYFVTGIE